MLKSTLYTSCLILLFTNCSIETAPIQYGSDSCYFCKMTIVDQQHAAQVVTKKGRNYKFDAIECMVNSLSQWPTEELHQLLVTDYATPKKMIAAESAFYLVSTSIPSPMGENLSSFEEEQMRNSVMLNPDDKALEWSALKSALAKQ